MHVYDIFNIVENFQIKALPSDKTGRAAYKLRAVTQSRKKLETERITLF